MLQRIKSIENVGQYETFTSTINLENNVELFGFNGAGKSTLSDIFYSLAREGKEDGIIRRKTLQKAGEDDEKDIKIEIESDAGDLYTFSGLKWSSRPNNMFVFNAQYIDEHVFVSRKLEGNYATIGMGKEGTLLLKQRDKLLAENVSLISEINDKIANLSKADLHMMQLAYIGSMQRLLRGMHQNY